MLVIVSFTAALNDKRKAKFKVLDTHNASDVQYEIVYCKSMKVINSKFGVVLNYFLGIGKIIAKTGRGKGVDQYLGVKEAYGVSFYRIGRFWYIHKDI